MEIVEGTHLLGILDRFGLNEQERPSHVVQADTQADNVDIPRRG